MHDVYAYGVVAPSTLVELADPYPPEAGYAEIAAVHPSVGGEAAGGAYVLARLGFSAKLDGNRLRDDEASRRALDMLAAAGVDCSAITLDPELPPLTEVVVASGAARTVLGTYGELAANRSWNRPVRADIERSRIVCLDPFFGAASEQVARWCRETTTPYVTIDTAPDSEIAGHAAVLIVSEEFASRTFGVFDPAELAASYTEHCAGLVIVTCGGERLWFGRRGEQPVERTPFEIDVRDTTGAGDSFRAGVISGMLRGLDDEQLVRTGSAVAALVCQSAPGFLNSPTEAELEAFLNRRGSGR